MKCGRNKPTQKQAVWLQRLRVQGYRAIVCYSCEEAMREICTYLRVAVP